MYSYSYREYPDAYYIDDADDVEPVDADRGSFSIRSFIHELEAEGFDLKQKLTLEVDPILETLTVDGPKV